MEIEQYPCGYTSEGEAIVEYVMRAGGGAEVVLTNIGASVMAVRTPDRAGRTADVVAGFSSATRYLHALNAPGAVAGCPLEQRPALWTGRVETDRVVFSLVLPGPTESEAVSLETVYDWNDALELEITYMAAAGTGLRADMYSRLAFDLSSGEDFSGQRLVVGAEPVEAERLPADGALLRRPVPGAAPDTLTLAAELTHPPSGRRVSMYTTREAVCAGLLQPTPSATPPCGYILSGCALHAPDPADAGPAPGGVFVHKTVWIFGTD